jgi:hypothetical protein
LGHLVDFALRLIANNGGLPRASFAVSMTCTTSTVVNLCRLKHSRLRLVPLSRVSTTRESALQMGHFIH